MAFLSIIPQTKMMGKYFVKPTNLKVIKEDGVEVVNLLILSLVCVKFIFLIYYVVLNVFVVVFI